MWKLKGIGQFLHVQNINEREGYASVGQRRDKYLRFRIHKKGNDEIVADS